jgi:hypothetical protein
LSLAISHTLPITEESFRLTSYFPRVKENLKLLLLYIRLCSSSNKHAGARSLAPKPAMMETNANHRKTHSQGGQGKV